MIDYIHKIKPEIIFLENEYLKYSFMDIYEKIKDIDFIKKIYVFIPSKNKEKSIEILNLKKVQFIDINSFENIINLKNKKKENNNFTLKKLLLADNEMEFHDLMEDIFKEKDYEIIHAFTGKEAFDLYKKEKPNIIIADYELPELNGLELCKRIKAGLNNQYLPIIITSSNGKKLDLNTVISFGADEYFIKPVEIFNLIEIVDSYISKLETQSRFKILVVDDSKFTLEIVCNALLKNNLNVITAFDGQEAFELAKRELPDIIITDIMMPKMDGYELCTKIKETPILRDSSIIMMSSLDKLSDIKKGQKLGITHYITKPFDSQKLVMVVSRILFEKNNLLKQDQENMLASIKALIIALEARDIYTNGHTQRVSEYSMKLAKYIGLSGYELQEIEISSTLHDLGKIGIKDEILFKEGILTAEEYKKIKEHPLIAVEILKPIKSLAHIIPLVYHHHERWDGKGYPDGLKKEEIPVGSRIIAIADAFDAITSDRPYKKRLSIEKALDIIKENLNTQFCPVFGKKFIEMMKKNKSYIKSI